MIAKTRYKEELFSIHRKIHEVAIPDITPHIMFLIKNSAEIIPTAKAIREKGLTASKTPNVAAKPLPPENFK